MSKVAGADAHVRERIKLYMKADRVSQGELARRIGSKQSRVSDMLRGERSIGPDILDRIADALGVTTRELLGLEKPGATRAGTGPGTSAFNERIEDPIAEKVLPPIGEVIRGKCIADLQRSAISDLPALASAKQKYQQRLRACASKFRDVEAFQKLKDYEWLMSNLRRLVLPEKAGHHRSIPDEIREAVETVTAFVARERPKGLRVSCAVLAGPVATLCALRSDPSYRLNIHLEIEDASGVELMRRVAKGGKADPYDFFVVATGAFNLTLVVDHQVAIYEPALPVHYEDQYSFYRPTRTGPPKFRSMHSYKLSSAAEEVIVGQEWSRNVQVLWRDQLEGVAERLPDIDRGEIVNVWDPLSRVVARRFPWATAVGKPYDSMICLYQHTDFSRPSQEKVGLAFKTLFVYEWNRLREHPSRAWRYLANDVPLATMISFGSGYHVWGGPADR